MPGLGAGFEQQERPGVYSGQSWEGLEQAEEVQEGSDRWG